MLPFWEGSLVQTLVCTGQAPIFLKTHPSNETEDLQNSIREINMSRKIAMPLKTSAHTHTQFLLLLRNLKLSHPCSSCQRRTMLASLCQASAKGCCWQRICSFMREQRGCDAWDTHGEGKLFSFRVTVGMRCNSVLKEQVWAPVAFTTRVEDLSLFPRFR